MAAAAGMPVRSGDRLTRREWLLLGLGAALLFSITYLTEPGIFGTIDWVRIHVFYKTYAAQAVRAGRLPLWNPHVALGRPFLADVDSALFYPPNVAYLLLPVTVACAVVTTAHLLLGLYGMVRFTRALSVAKPISVVAAFVFVASAPIVGSFHSGLIHYGAALCYLPLVFFLCVRLQEDRSVRLVATLAIVLGLQLMGGHPQASWLTMLGATVFLVGRRWQRPLGAAAKQVAFDLAAFAVATGWALALAGVTLLPLWELLRQSNRDAPTLAFAGSFSMPSFAWGSLVMPSGPGFSFFANAQLYIGVAPLVAGLCGLLLVRDRNARALALVALIAAIVAAGRTTPLFGVLYHLVPGLATMRIHARASVLIALALVTAAAIFCSGGRARVWASVAVGVVVLVASMAFAAFWPGFMGAAAPRVAVRAALVVVSTGLVVAWLCRDRLPARGSMLVSALLLIVVAIDLTQAARGLKGQNRDESERPGEAAVHEGLAAQGLFPSTGVPPRISIPKPYVRENAGMTEGWSTFTGYASLMLGRVWSYLHAMRGLPIPIDQNTYPASEIFRQTPFPYDTMNLVLGLDPHTRQPVLNRAPDARVYVAPAVEAMSDWRAALDRLRSGHDGHRVALVEESLTLAPAAGEATAAITRFEPERVVVHTEGAGGLLVLAEAWYPGWTVTIDGVPGRCVPVNVWMRGVPLASGAHEVVFRFHSTWLVPGALLTLASLALALALLVLFRRAANNGPAAVV